MPILCFIGVLASLGCGWTDVDLWKQKREPRSVFTGIHPVKGDPGDL